MPAWLQKICVVLPFKYAIYLPVKIFLGKMGISEALWGILLQVFWIMVFLLMGKYLWKFGIRKYQAYGG